MLLISQKFPCPEKLNDLAAHLELASNLSTILRDPTKGELAGFNLLYEWVKYKGGRKSRKASSTSLIDTSQPAKSQSSQKEAQIDQQ